MDWIWLKDYILPTPAIIALKLSFPKSPVFGYEKILS